MSNRESVGRRLRPVRSLSAVNPAPYLVLRQTDNQVLPYADASWASNTRANRQVQRSLDGRSWIVAGRYSSVRGSGWAAQ